MNVNFFSEDGHHQCTSHREGDWIVFTCPECKGYERRYNWKTGEIKTQTGVDPSILHQGSFQPVGIEAAEVHPN